MKRLKTSSLIAVFSGIVVLSMAAVAAADQPFLGFSGTLVDVPKQFGPGNGYRVDGVRRGTPAHRMGLERGDIVVYITNFAFTSREGYLWALRQQGQRARIGIRNVRNGKLTWRNCWLGHNPGPHQGEPMPGGVIIAD